jgi:geranylgeranyl diphosphate synthase type I
MLQHPAAAGDAAPPGPAPAAEVAAADLAGWQLRFRQRVGAALDEYVIARCDEYVRGVPGADLLTELLASSVSGGKYVRSTFTYLGWLCGAGESDPGEIDPGESDAALRAAAATELLHAFALIQDDVMDRSVMRRGRTAAHVRLAGWYGAQNLAGDAAHFGESAAVLLGDLLLVWADRLLRESGLHRDALQRAWPVWDTLRGELAVGQFADLVYDARHLPPMEAVLDMSRRKSGNYTVRRPLELGAALAGCDDVVQGALSRYGGLIGEAFQLRDDLLGVYGQPSVTGKPNGGDLREHKATSVIALAAELAGKAPAQELTKLHARDRLTDADLDRMRELIAQTGAVDRIERMIDSRVTAACASLEHAGIDGLAQNLLSDLAVRATSRAR